MFTVDETHQLLKLHEKLHHLNKLLQDANLKAVVFKVDLDAHKTQVDEIKSDMSPIVSKLYSRKGIPRDLPQKSNHTRVFTLVWFLRFFLLHFPLFQFLSSLNEKV